MMPGVNFIIYGCSSARSTPELSLYWSLILEGNTVAVINQDRTIDDNLIDDKIKTRLCVLVNYSY